MQLIPFPLCEGLGEIHRTNQLSRPTVGLTGLESNSLTVQTKQRTLVSDHMFNHFQDLFVNSEDASWQSRLFVSFCLFASSFWGRFALFRVFLLHPDVFRRDLFPSHCNFFICCMYKCRNFCIVRVEHKRGWQDLINPEIRPIWPMWSSSC